MARAYSALYLSDIVDLQGDMFLQIRDVLPGVDEKWFIEKWMRSRIRELLDNGSPKFAAMLPQEVILYFLEEELNSEYQRGSEWGGFLPEWVGLIYSYFQWRYNIPSRLIIEMLPLSEMEFMFPTLHQTSLQTAAEKIHDDVLELPPTE